MAHDSKLKFLRTLTIDQFKKYANMDKIVPMRKPGGTAVSFEYTDPKWGLCTGPVALTEDGKIPSPVMISLVQGDVDPYHPEREGLFWMAHKESTARKDYEVVAEW